MKQVLTILAIMAATSVPASLFAAKTTATCSLITHQIQKSNGYLAAIKLFG